MAAVTEKPTPNPRAFAPRRSRRSPRRASIRDGVYLNYGTAKGRRNRQRLCQRRREHNGRVPLTNTGIGKPRRSIGLQRRLKKSSGGSRLQARSAECLDLDLGVSSSFTNTADHVRVRLSRITIHIPPISHCLVTQLSEYLVLGSAKQQTREERKRRGKEFKVLIETLTFRYMRLVIAVAIVAGISAATPSTSTRVSAQTSALWLPDVRPAACATVDTQLELLDVSKSMQNGNLFARAVEQIAQYVDDAPNCTYVILGRFGTTADIVDHGFLITPPVRERLKASLRSLQPRHETTNFDEAAKLIEWVQFKIASAYIDAPSSLSVKVLSDGVSSPDADKTDFSLRSFFETRLIDGRVNVLEIALRPSGPSPVMPSPPERYMVLATPVGTLGELLRTTTGIVDPSAVEAAKTRTVANGPAEVKQVPSDQATVAHDKGTGGNPTALDRAAGPPQWVLFAAAAALSLLLALSVVRRRRAIGDALEIPLDEEHAPAPRVSIAMLITERELSDKQNEPAHVLRDNQRLPIATNAPVVFGTDAGAATCVVIPVTGIEADELFRVTPTSGGLLHLRAIPQALCDGQAVPQKGLTLAANQPFRVRIGAREWLITPTDDPAAPGAVDDLFARMWADRGPAANPADA